MILKTVATGVPAILTLQSGAARAAISSGCIANTIGAQTQTAPLSGARCESGTTVPSNNTVWKYQLESAFNGGGADVLDGGAGGAGDSYCLVYLDANGGIPTSTPWGGATANGLPDATHYAITTSCWTSFY